jgi:hypothetical protein
VILVVALVASAILIVCFTTRTQCYDDDIQMRLQSLDENCTYSSEAVIVKPCSGPCGQQTETIAYNSVPEGACPPKYETVACPNGHGDPCSCKFETLKNMLDPATADIVLPCGPNCDMAQTDQKCRVRCPDVHPRSGLAQESVGGSDTYTCLTDGTWAHEENQFRCENKMTRCPPIVNGRAQSVQGSCMDAKPGDSCMVQCHIGYTTRGAPNVAQCKADGTWTVPEFGCVPNACCRAGSNC